MSMKLSKQGLSSREEFIKFIETIGFKYDIIGDYYCYKEFIIYFYNNYYHFYNGYGWNGRYELNDLTPLKIVSRSYKLKKILG